MKKLIKAAVVAATAICAVQAAEARNVILIVGDGMDDVHVTMARNYLKGYNGRLLLDKMPVRSTAQVQTIENGDSGKPVYVADSANSATSLATGIVTSMGRIGTSSEDKDLKTIAEMAKEKGMKVGIVSTASVTDATPSSFLAHISFRTCENPGHMVEHKVGGEFIVDCSPDLKANGGPGSIAEQLIDSDVDVLLGGGSEHFDVALKEGGPTVSDMAAEKGFTLVRTPDELDAASNDGRLIGLFGADTMPVRMRGEDGRGSEKPDPSFLNYIHMYLGEVTLPEPKKCEANPDYVGVPSLKQMTDAALSRLEGSKGFFLMVESASIDKQAHVRRPCGSIGELEQLEEALQSALDFAQSNPDTLILVTADHGQSAQIIPETSMYSAFGIPVFSRGHMSRIETPEGAIMGINYATNDFMIEEHTGGTVPVYGNGVARGRLPAMVNQAEIFGIMADYLRLKR